MHFIGLTAAASSIQLKYMGTFYTTGAIIIKLLLQSKVLILLVYHSQETYQVRHRGIPCMQLDMGGACFKCSYWLLLLALAGLLLRLVAGGAGGGTSGGAC